MRFFRIYRDNDDVKQNLLRSIKCCVGNNLTILHYTAFLLFLIQLFLSSQNFHHCDELQSGMVNVVTADLWFPFTYEQQSTYIQPKIKVEFSSAPQAVQARKSENSDKNIVL